MKIGLIGYEANITNRVGSNQYAFELMKAMARLDRENDYLIFLSRPPVADLPAEREGWRYVVTGPGKLWNWLGLPRAIWRERTELDLVFNPGHYAPISFGLPTVVSVMDLGYLRYPRQFHLLTYLQLKYWTAFSVKKAVRVLAISESTRRDLVRTYFLPASKVVTTLLGYDKQLFHTHLRFGELERVKNKYRLAGDYVLYLGTLKPSKNIEGLLEAFSLFRQLGRRPLKLVIAGKKGWLYEKIAALVTRLSLEKEVIFTDFVPPADVPALMKGARLLILPSFWEGFGLPVLEAMAVGTPVVAAEVGSLPEVVGRAGILINPCFVEEIAAGISAGLSGRDELSRLAVKQAALFSWDTCARQTIEVLKQAADLPRIR